MLDLYRSQIPSSIWLGMPPCPEAEQGDPVPSLGTGNCAGELRAVDRGLTRVLSVGELVIAVLDQETPSEVRDFPAWMLNIGVSSGKPVKLHKIGVLMTIAFFFLYVSGALQKRAETGVSKITECLSCRSQNVQGASSACLEIRFPFPSTPLPIP